MQESGSKDRVLPVEAELPERLIWFIRLRWMAGAGVLIGVWAIVGWAQVPIPPYPLYEVGVGVLAYNAVFHVFSKRWKDRPPPIPASRMFAHAQIGVDWMALTLLVLRSGGVRSPVAFAFIFHVIIAADLLPRRACYAHTGIGMLLVGGVAALEYAGLWSPGLVIRVPAEGMVVVAHALFLIGTFGVASFLGTSITNELRRRERELADSEQALAQAYHRLEKVDQDKSRFALTVTHELRSPLASATSLLETLSEGYAGPLTERQADLVRRAKVRTEGLRALVNDLLDLAAGRTEMKGKLPVPTDLRGVAAGVLEAGRGRAEGGGITIVADLPEEPLTVLADPEDLRLALSNLVDNAVKYTPNGGNITVELRKTLVPEMGNSKSGMKGGPGTEGWVQVDVADTGIGIPPEGISRVFEDFYRAPNAKAVKTDGTGLGLAIVKGIVERYGGRIRVESEMGKGSRFRILWPIHGAAE